MRRNLTSKRPDLPAILASCPFAAPRPGKGPHRVDQGTIGMWPLVHKHINHTYGDGLWHLGTLRLTTGRMNRIDASRRSGPPTKDRKDQGCHDPQPCSKTKHIFHPGRCIFGNRRKLIARQKGVMSSAQRRNGRTKRSTFPPLATGRTVTARKAIQIYIGLDVKNTSPTWEGCDPVEGRWASNSS